MCRLSLSVGWENGPEPGLMTLSFNPFHEIQANSADPDQTTRAVESDLGLHCLPISQSRFYMTS